MNTDIEKANKQAKIDQIHSNIEQVKTWFNASSHYLTGPFTLSFDMEVSTKIHGTESWQLLPSMNLKESQE